LIPQPSGKSSTTPTPDALWLVVGTPAEAANTLEMTPDQLAELYPDGPKALPPELVR
jgi:hypothetical protein